MRKLTSAGQQLPTEHPRQLVRHLRRDDIETVRIEAERLPETTVTLDSTRILRMLNPVVKIHATSQSNTTFTLLATGGPDYDPIEVHVHTASDTATWSSGDILGRLRQITIPE